MSTLVRRKPTLRRKAAGKRAARKSPPTKLELTPEDVALDNAVGAAAACDLASRTVATDADDCALVNAVARAAARSLAS